MKLSPEQITKLKRLLLNALIFGAAAGATAALQYLQGQDFGMATPYIVAVIGIVLKAIQGMVTPPPGPL